MTATVADKARVRQINQNVKLFGAFELAFEELREATTKEVDSRQGVGVAGQEEHWQQRFRWERQCFKVEMTKRAGDWLEAKERSFSIRCVMDGTTLRMSYASCDFNELSNFMITHGHIPTCFYNSNSGYKWNSVRGTWESDSRRESKLCCELQNETAKLKLHKFINSINGVKWVQKVLIEEFYLEHLSKQFLAVSWSWNYFNLMEKVKLKSNSALHFIQLLWILDLWSQFLTQLSVILQTDIEQLMYL